jgi:alkaline phosphatase
MCHLSIFFRAAVGFTTPGHGGMDVNLYGMNTEGLSGNVDNTDLAHYSAIYLGVQDQLQNLTDSMSKLNFRLQKRDRVYHPHVHGGIRFVSPVEELPKGKLD